MTDTRTDAETVLYTADLVAVRGDEILAIRRRWAPYEGCLALPGGHVDPGEMSQAAAAREAAEETGLAVDVDLLRLVGVYDDPDRDSRGRVVSVAYALDLPAGASVPVHAGGDAAAAEWLPIDVLLAERIAFDHRQIIGDALAGS